MVETVLCKAFAHGFPAVKRYLIDCVKLLLIMLHFSLINIPLEIIIISTISRIFMTKLFPSVPTQFCRRLRRFDEKSAMLTHRRFRDILHCFAEMKQRGELMNIDEDAVIEDMVIRYTWLWSKTWFQEPVQLIAAYHLRVGWGTRAILCW